MVSESENQNDGAEIEEDEGVERKEDDVSRKMFTLGFFIGGLVFPAGVLVLLLTEMFWIGLGLFLIGILSFGVGLSLYAKDTAVESTGLK